MNINSDIFKYATISHITLFMSYLLYSKYIHKINKRNIYTIVSITTLLYLVGHILISSAMYNRINTDNIGKLNPTILGIIGHSCLLSFSLLANRNSMYFETGDIIFILGQIGMIYNYYSDYKYNNNKIKPNYNYLILIPTFLLLNIFYLKKSYIAFNKFRYGPAIGLLLVGILYLIFCGQKIYDYYKEYKRNLKD